MAYTAAHNTAQAGLFGRIEAFIEARREAAAKRRIFRRTMNELQSLSARDLADLGIARSQIQSVAHEAAYGA